ncbi:MAG TPA: serine/threonine-protein kinase, partial [Terriglobales bacterium]
MVIEKIGRYEIIEELGRGAMGVVYKARDPNIGRLVALKTMRLDVAGLEHDEILRRFRHEARAAGRMNHPNLVIVHDADESDGLFFIAMEYIQGETLYSILARQKTLPIEKIIELSRHICAGLDYAHSMGVIHRDVKSANIMITPQGTAKIM